MKLDDLIGNAKTKQALKAALANNTLPHAVLFAAPAGCGTGFAARALAADYLFPSGGGAADAVIRSEGSEVLLVEGEGKSGQIPVDRIRQIRSDIFHTALSAAGRVVIIRDAQKMAAPAANALLKVLEEPPVGALFILTAPSVSSLVPTILSRCAVYPLAPTSESECRAALQKILPLDINASLTPLLATIYGGRIGAGYKILSSQDRLSLLSDALNIATAAAARNRYALLCLFARYEGRAEEDRARRDALLSDLSCVLSANLTGRKAEGLPSIPPAVAALLLPPIAEARLALQGNAAPKITFTALTVRLTQAGLSAS